MFSEYTDDARLVRDLRKRESKAFEYLRDKCYRTVRIQVKELLGSPDETDDIFNESIARLLPMIDDPKLKLKSKVITLFLAITRNLLLTGKRDREVATRNTEHGEPSYEEDFDARMDRVMFEDILWKSFARLKKDCQRILREFFSGLGLQEIAEAMGLSYMYVRKKKVACHKTLLQFVNEDRDFKRVKHEPR